MRKYYFVLFSIFFIALITLASSSRLWYDEEFTYLVAHLDLAHLIQATAADVHPPLHYLLMWFISHIPISGVHELLTRGWSIVFSIISFGVFCLITQILDIPKPVKVIAWALFVLSPTQLYYGQEGRMYALLQTLVLIQIYAVLRRKWWLVGISTTLMLYTHNYAIFFTTITGLVALARELTMTAKHLDIEPIFYDQEDIDKLPKARSNLAGLFISFAIPGLLYLPWFFYATIPQMNFFKDGGHWILPVTFGNALWDIFVSMIGTWYSNSVVLTQFLMVMAGLMLVILSNFKAKNIQILILAFGPWLLAITASLIVAPIMLARAFLPSTPFIFLLVGDALYHSGLHGRVIGALLLVPVVIISLYGLGYNTIHGTLHGNNFVEIPQNLEPGQMIIHLEDSTLIPSLVYGQPGDQRLLDAGCPEQLGALGPRVRQAMGIKTIKFSDLPSHYYLEAAVGALSTTCHLQIFDQLTNQAKTLASFSNAYGKMGFYELLPR